jgi:hypothetical protein
MRRRKARGITKRKRGVSRRIARGDNARRMKNGTEMAKTATSTTEVMLSVCIIAKLAKPRA